MKKMIMADFMTRLLLVSGFSFITLINPSGTFGQDSSIVKGRHIVIKPVDQDILKTRTNDPSTDRIFDKFSISQVELILKKTQEKIKLSQDEEKRLSELLDENNERFISIFKKSAVLDEILMRQAEIQYQKVLKKYYEDQAVYNVKLDAYVKKLDQYEKKEISEKPEEPKPAIKDFQKVIGLYDYVINEMPDSKYVPDALYSKAYIYGWEEGNVELGVKTLEILTRKYPSSRYVLESNWLIGEFLFNSPDDAKLRRARSHFQKVLELSAAADYPTRRFGESLYRLAWVSYKLRDFSDAIAYFTFLMDDIQSNKEMYDGKQLPSFVRPEMFEESAQYIGICFMDIVKREYSKRSDSPATGAVLDKMVSYFSRFNPPKTYEPFVYERLGQSYGEVDDIKEIQHIYAYLVKRYPESERSGDLARELVEIKEREIGGEKGLKELELREEVYKLKKEYFQTYNYRSPWYSTQLARFNAQNSPNADYSSKGIVKRYIEPGMFTAIDSTSQKYFIDNMNMDLFYALVFAGDEQREGLTSDAGRATGFYDRYIGDVKTYFDYYSRYDSVAYENGYYLALVLDQKVGRSLEAYPYYLEVARNPFAEHHRFETALNAISIAVDDLNKSEKTTPKVTLSALPRARALVADSLLKDLKFLAYVDTLSLTGSEKRLIEAYDNFARLFPHVAKTSEYVENISLIYFNKNQLDQVADWQVILQKYYPDRKINPGYVTDLMQGYFRVKDYPSAELLAKAIITMKDASAKQKDYATLIWSTSIGLMAQIEEGRGNFSAAAEQWYRIYTDTPGYKDVDQAIYFAAENYDKEKEFNRSNELYNQLIDRFPNSTKLVENAHRNIYSNLIEMKAFSLSSKQAERNYYYFAKNNNAELSEYYLYKAFEDSKKAKDLKEAFRLSELYVEKFPDSPYATEVLFGTIALQTDMKDDKGVFEAYGKFAAKFPDDFRTVEAFYRRALYLAKQNDRPGALIEYRAAVDRNRELKKKAKQSSPFFAGESLYELGKELWDSFSAVTINFNNGDTEIPRKETAFKTYRDNQVELRSLGLEPGGSFYRAIEATFNIGKAYEEIADQAGSRNAEDGGFRGQDFITKQTEVHYTAKDYYNNGYQIYLQTFNQIRDFQKAINKLLEQNLDSIKTNDVSIPDSTLKLMARLDSITATKTSEMLYHAAEAQHKIVNIIIEDKSILSSITDPNLYMQVWAGLIDNISADVEDAIALYRKNMDLSAELKIENDWVQKSRQAITDLSDLKASKYEELVRYSIEAFDHNLEEFAKVVETDVEPASDAIINKQTVITTSVENSKIYVGTTINEYANALKIVDANNLGKDLRLQVENRTTQFLYSVGTVELERGNSLQQTRKRYDQISISKPELYWYLDATYTLDDITNILKATGMEILENGIGFMTSYGVYTEWTGKIITKLITVDPQKYGSLLGDIDLRSSLVYQTDDTWKASTDTGDDWYTQSLNDTVWNQAEIAYSASKLVVDYTDNLSGPKSSSITPVWYYSPDDNSSAVDSAGVKNTPYFFITVNDTDIVADSSKQTDTVPAETTVETVTSPVSDSSAVSASVSSDTSATVIAQPADSVKQTPSVIPQPEVQATAPAVKVASDRFDYSNRATEKPDQGSAGKTPDQVVFRKTFFVDGTIDNGSLIVGKNIASEVYLNDNQLDVSIGKDTPDGKAIVFDVSKILVNGKNLLAVKTNAEGSYNKNLYSLVNVVYYPEIPSEKILRIFSSKYQLPGVKTQNTEEKPVDPPKTEAPSGDKPQDGGQ